MKSEPSKHSAIEGRLAAEEPAQSNAQMATPAAT
jgi:hypothetical protein